MMLKVVIFTVLVSYCAGQLVAEPCPNVPVVQEFDVGRYLGQWYQLARFPNFYEFGDCSTAKYGPVDNNGKVVVNNSEIVNGKPSNQVGTAELADPNSTEAKLLVTFNVQGQTNVADYWVVGTDYDNYSLVWSCRKINETSSYQYAWVLGRSKPLSFTSLSKVFALISETGIDASKFEVHELPECTNAP